jgi:hypothetical protein
MKPEGSLPCTQNRGTGPYPEPDGAEVTHIFNPTRQSASYMYYQL